MFSKNITAAACCMIMTLSAHAQTLDPNDIGKAPDRQEQLTRKGVPELRREVNDAYQNKDYRALRDALMALRTLRPYNSEYMFQLVLANSLLQDRSAAYDTMLRMQRQGLAYDFNEVEEAEYIRGTDVYTHLNDMMIAAGEPLGQAEVITELPADLLLPESIAWDPNREAFLVGSIADGLIMQVGLDGGKKELLRSNEENGLWGIYGLAVDAKRNRLFASTASNPQFRGADPVDQGRSMLIEFQLDTMEILKRYPVAVDGRPHILGKIAVGASGEVYVTDALLPMVYLMTPGESVLRPFFSMPYLVNLRGMDISDDGRMLYLADYEMGITVIDLGVGKSKRLVTPANLNLGGIEGLATWQNSLVIVQSGIRPQRIMRLDLDESRLGVKSTSPVAVALDMFDAPKYGTMVGDEFYFFAASQWGKQTPVPVPIARTNIANTPTMVDPQLEKLMEEYRKSREAGAVKPGEFKPGETGKDRE